MTDEKPEKPGGLIAVGVHEGRVILRLHDADVTAVLNAAQAMDLANGIFKHAKSIDAALINEQLQTDDSMLTLYARMLFAAAGMYLTRKSAVGIADANESVGLAIRLLVQEADRAVQFDKLRRRDDHGRGHTQTD